MVVFKSAHLAATRRTSGGRGGGGNTSDHAQLSSHTLIQNATPPEGNLHLVITFPYIIFFCYLYQWGRKYGFVLAGMKKVPLLLYLDVYCRVLLQKSKFATRRAHIINMPNRQTNSITAMTQAILHSGSDYCLIIHFSCTLHKWNQQEIQMPNTCKVSHSNTYYYRSSTRNCRLDRRYFWQ